MNTDEDVHFLEERSDSLSQILDFGALAHGHRRFRQNAGFSGTVT